MPERSSGCINETLLALCVRKKRLQRKMTKQSSENRRKECHRFWLRLLHAVILISKVRTSASKKINGMALI